VLATADIEVMPLTDEVGRIALDAFDRYGKGRRHPAQLNMGDCFAYACAKFRGVPLLYKGSDFSRTDLA
jgi:ribonuclease VapC